MATRYKYTCESCQKAQATKLAVVKQGEGQYQTRVCSGCGAAYSASFGENVELVSIP